VEGGYFFLAGLALAFATAGRFTAPFAGADFFAGAGFFAGATFAAGALAAAGGAFGGAGGAAAAITVFSTGRDTTLGAECSSG